MAYIGAVLAVYSRVVQPRVLWSLEFITGVVVFGEASYNPTMRYLNLVNVRMVVCCW